MKLIFPLTALVISLTASLNAAVLVGFDPDGFVGNQSNPWASSYSPTVGTVTIASGVQITQGLTPGSGVTSFGGLNNAWGGSMQETSQTAAIIEGDFYTFSLQAASGNTLSLDSINWNLRLTSALFADQTVRYIWQYKVGEGEFTDVGGVVTPGSFGVYNTNGVAQPTVSLSGVGSLQNTSEEITFRLVGWNVNGSNTALNIGRLSGNDLVINGTVAVPEPSVLEFTGMALIFGIFALTRKRFSAIFS